jgi:hypothetical protein
MIARAWSAMWIALVCAIAGCSHPQASAPVAPELVEPQRFDTGAFRHDTHLNLSDRKLECRSCHAADAKNGFTMKRPGWNQHAPCDDCHREAFFEAPGRICAVCHTKIEVANGGGSPLLVYPGRHEVAELVGAFSHQVHLDPARVKLSGGARCIACHRVESAGEAYASFATHTECAPCHSETAHPLMNDCEACHARSGPGLARHFLKNDVRFTHGKHQKDRGGRPVACERCHHAVPGSTGADDLALPQMSDCTTCHEDMATCGLCHTTDVRSKRLPGDHTR